MVGRRKFLLTAGATILAAPTLTTLKTFNSFGASGAPARRIANVPYPVDRTLDRLVEKYQDGNRFLSAAGTIIQVAPMTLLPAPAALLNILDSLELGSGFSGRVGYCNARVCRSNFEQEEEVLRRHYNEFTDILRSPKDEDVAYLVGGNIDSTRHLTEAAGATQFRGHPSFGLSGNEPGILRAAAALFHKDYNPSPKEVAQSFAVTEMEPWLENGTQVGTRVETPVTSFIHDQRAYEDAPLGALIVRNKARNDSIAYCAGLHA